MDNDQLKNGKEPSSFWATLGKVASLGVTAISLVLAILAFPLQQQPWIWAMIGGATILCFIVAFFIWITQKPRKAVTLRLPSGSVTLLAAIALLVLMTWATVSGFWSSLIFMIPLVVGIGSYVAFEYLKPFRSDDKWNRPI